MSRSTILKAAIASLSFVAAASAAPIIVDISATSSPGNRPVVATADGSADVAWNEIANSTTAGRNTIANLVDTANAPSGITLLVTSSGNVASGGRVISTNFAGSPAASMFSAGMMGNALSKLSGAAATAYKLSGLDPASTYDFDFLSSLTTPTDAATAGTSSFTLVGASSTSSSIAAGGNTALLSIDNVAPNALGEISITWAISGATNYAPLNVFQFEESVPEPTSLAAIGLAGAALLRRRRSC